MNFFSLKGGIIVKQARAPTDGKRPQPAASSPLGGRRASRMCPVSCRSFAVGGF